MFKLAILYSFHLVCFTRETAFALKNTIGAVTSLGLSFLELDASTIPLLVGRRMFECRGEIMLAEAFSAIWRILMMTRGSLYIQETNLSRDWARAFLEAATPGGGEIQPLVVTVTGFVGNQPSETLSIRQALDRTLLRNNQFLCETVANTIFPQSLWNSTEGREQLFRRYKNLLPQMRKLEVRNKYGLYFERLVAFGPQEVNQLDHIIRTYCSGNHRRSALQASVFDPSVDHTNQRQRGFPCMQQIAFIPYGNGEMAVTAFYAT